MKGEVCIAVELNSRPTIRVVSRLCSEKTKQNPIANEKAMTSWSNRPNGFLRPAGFYHSKWRANGTQFAAKTEHIPNVDLEVYGCPKYDACSKPKICNLAVNRL